MSVNAVIWFVILMLIMLVFPILVYVFIPEKENCSDKEWKINSKNIVLGKSKEVFVVILVCIVINWGLFFVLR